MKKYIKEKSLTVGIIGMISFFIVLYFESKFGIEFLTYLRIGYAISFGMSLLSLYFAIKSALLEVEDKKTTKKILLYFGLTNFMMILYAIFKIEIDLWNLIIIVLMVLGCNTILDDKASIKDKIKLLCAFLLASSIAYFSCFRMTTKYIRYEDINYNNGETNEIVNNDIDKVEYDYLYDENLANQLMETYEEVCRVVKKMVKNYNYDNSEGIDNIDKYDLIFDLHDFSKELKIGITSDAGKVMPREVFVESAFDEEDSIFFPIDFEGEFYDMVKEYNIETDMFSDDQKEKLKYIISDDVGNLYINPSFFITKIDKK